jgi:hypothetical protein
MTSSEKLKKDGHKWNRISLGYKTFFTNER